MLTLLVFDLRIEPEEADAAWPEDSDLRKHRRAGQHSTAVDQRVHQGRMSHNCVDVYVVKEEVAQEAVVTEVISDQTTCHAKWDHLHHFACLALAIVKPLCLGGFHLDPMVHAQATAPPARRKHCRQRCWVHDCGARQECSTSDLWTLTLSCLRSTMERGARRHGSHQTRRLRQHSKASRALMAHSASARSASGAK